MAEQKSSAFALNEQDSVPVGTMRFNRRHRCQSNYVTNASSPVGEVTTSDSNKKVFPQMENIICVL